MILWLIQTEITLKAWKKPLNGGIPGFRSLLFCGFCLALIISSLLLRSYLQPGQHSSHLCRPLIAHLKHFYSYPQKGKPGWVVSCSRSLLTKCEVLYLWLQTLKIQNHKYWGQKEKHLSLVSVGKYVCCCPSQDMSHAVSWEIIHIWEQTVAQFFTFPWQRSMQLSKEILPVQRA